MSVFESVRYRLLLSTAVAASPPPAAVTCAVSLSAAHVRHRPKRGGLAPQRVSSRYPPSRFGGWVQGPLRRVFAFLGSTHQLTGL